MISTTNAIEPLNASQWKVTKTRRSFLIDQSVIKVLYLALHFKAVSDANHELESGDELGLPSQS